MVQARGYMMTAALFRDGTYQALSCNPSRVVSVSSSVRPAQVGGLDGVARPLRREDREAHGEDDPVHDDQGHERHERAAQHGPPQRTAALARDPRDTHADDEEDDAGGQRQQAAEGCRADALDEQSVCLDQTGHDTDDAEDERERGAEARGEPSVQLRAQRQNGCRQEHGEHVVGAIRSGTHEHEVHQEEVRDDGEDAGDERPALEGVGTGGRVKTAAPRIATSGRPAGAVRRRLQKGGAGLGHAHTPSQTTRRQYRASLSEQAGAAHPPAGGLQPPRRRNTPRPRRAEARAAARPRPPPPAGARRRAAATR